MERRIRLLLGSVLLAVLVLLTLDSHQPAIGRSFYVSPSGNNTNSGGPGSPWRTLAMANLTVRPGDTVFVSQGVYTDPVSPLGSGGPGAPIVFRAAPGETPRIVAARGISIRPGSSYIVVDGFTVEAKERTVEIEDAAYITIRRCTLYGGVFYQTFLVQNSSFCRIQDNFLDRQDPVGTGDGGDGLKVLGRSHHNVIERNVVTGCAHQGLGSSYADGPKNFNVFRNNLVYGCHTNFGFEENVDRYLIEGNVSYYPGLVYTPDGGHSVQVSGTSNCIYRYNVFYDDTASIAATDIVQQVVGTSAFPYHDMTGIRFYNNTMYGESDEQYGRYVFRVDENFPDRIIDGNILKNNILARPTKDFPVVNEESSHRSSSELNTLYEANLLWRTKPGDPVVRLQGTDGNFIWTLAEVKRARPQYWLPSNIEGDPQFVNTAGQGPGKDFHLQQTSPAIDAGAHLTVASGGGVNATQLKVGDAGYFTDGWGIVEADSLRIDGAVPSELVGITSVDYTTNTIGLTGARSWSPNARIWYYRSDRHRGKAPDIGALEFGSSAVEPPPPPPPPPVPDPPSPAAPPNGAVDLPGSATLEWKPVTNALSYVLEISGTPAFSSFIAREVGLTAVTYPLSGLIAGRTYYWRVAASNASGTGAWSSVWNFTTKAGEGLVSILVNPGFEEGTSSWTFYTDGEGTFTTSVPAYQGALAARVSITRPGSNTQLRQFNVPLQPNSQYRLSFAARSNNPIEIEVGTLKETAPFTNYGLDGYRVGLTPSWQVFETQFVTQNFSSPINDARLMFWFGNAGQPNDVLSLDNVILAYVGPVSPPQPPAIPRDWALEQNYPNPFNPTTTILYKLPSPAFVRLNLYDVLGKLVQKLVEQEQPAGAHTVTVDSGNLASGMYFYAIQAGSFFEMRRMLLIR